jgi:hypothetical protein
MLCMPASVIQEKAGRTINILEKWVHIQYDCETYCKQLRRMTFGELHSSTYSCILQSNNLTKRCKHVFICPKRTTFITGSEAVVLFAWAFFRKCDSSAITTWTKKKNIDTRTKCSQVIKIENTTLLSSIINRHL